MRLDFFLELISTLLSLVFLVGIIRRNAWAWPFGILGSATSVVLFANSGLYSEAGLYCLYVVMGIYGWVQWNSIDTGTAVALVDVPLKMQWPAIAGIPLAILLGTKMASVEGVSYPYFDAFTTVFALIATYQEARRIRTAFHYWIPLNIASMVLYGMKGLVIYAALMFIYSVMSVLGYLNWRK